MKLLDNFLLTPLGGLGHRGWQFVRSALSVTVALGFLGLPGTALGEPALIGVNAGSLDSVTVLDGTVFLPDRIYRPPNEYGALSGTRSETGSIEMDFLHRDRSALEDSLHRRQRIGAEGYVFALNDGTYEVTIHTAEFHRHGAGHWKASIFAEGQPIVEDFDVIEEVGECRIIDIRAVVDVDDGFLDLEFPDSTGNFPVSAISIRNGDPFDEDPPLTPTGLEAQGAHGGVLLVWDRNLENDLAGYRVLREVEGAWEVVSNRRFVRIAQVEATLPARYGVVAFDVYGNVSDTTFSEVTSPGVDPPSALPLYAIEISEEDRLALDTDPAADVDVLGDLWVEETLFADVEFSYRGSTERGAPKKSWNVNLEDNPPLDSATKLALKATFSDPTVQRESLYAAFMARNGLACSETVPVRVEVNGEYRGVQMRVERVNEDFVTRRGWSAEGRLYRGNANLMPLPTVGHYRAMYEPAINKDWDRSDLVQLVESLDKTPPRDILPWLESNVDVEQVLDLVCHHAIVANIDWVHDDYYLYREDPGSRWQLIPWDLHETFGWYYQPLGYGTIDEPDHTGLHNQILERIFSVPSLRRRYTEKLRSYVDTELTSGRLEADAEAAHEFLGEDIWTDMWKADRERALAYSKNVRSLVNFFDKRADYLLENLPDFELPEHSLVHMAELVSQGEEVEAVEVLNLGTRAFTLSGFSLTDDLADPAKWPIDAVEIPAGGRVVLPFSGVGRGAWIALTRSEGGGDALVDSVTVPADLPLGWSLGRYPDTSGRWRPLAAVSPGEPNVWVSPVAVELGVEPREIELGRRLTLDIGLENTGAQTSQGELQLLLETRDGLRHPMNPLKSARVRIAPGQRHRWTVTVPVSAKFVDVGGGILSLVFVLGDDDEIARDSREIFIVGDPEVPVVINEFLAANDSSLADEMGEFDDWVELHNASDVEIQASSLYLTDDLEDEPFKWPLPEVRIEPRGHLVIWCDNDEEQGPLHASFKLSSAGEEVALVDGRFPGEPIVLDHWVFGSQETDVSMGRYPDGNPDWLHPDYPTGGSANVYSQMDAR